MRNVINKIKLEKAAYRKIKESFTEFMHEATSGIETGMVKQIPEYAELALTPEFKNRNRHKPHNSGIIVRFY